MRENGEVDEGKHRGTDWIVKVTENERELQIDGIACIVHSYGASFCV
jgi:hypothetical protein